MHLPFWLTTALLLPLIIHQGRRVRLLTPRLPEAGGNPDGQYGTGDPALRLLVIGESTAAGVGVDDHAQGLASQLALRVHRRTGKAVAWHTRGTNGIRLRQLNRQLDPANLPQADAVILSMGVNDTKGFTSRFRFRQQLLGLRANLAHRYSAPLILLRVPPMHRFTALPQPLRALLGWRARQLDQIYRELAERQPEHFIYQGYPALTASGLLACDGFHPSEQGYQTIAEALAPAV